MLDRDDLLIAEFGDRGSEEAFAALVRQHINLVFVTAMRQVGDRGESEEIAQNVFVTLARSAGKLRSHPTLAGWLHQTTLNKSREWLRAELRRRRRDQVAVDLESVRAGGDSVWASLVPLLDEALLELRDQDRLAVILRFMEGRTFREVGLVLGVSEDTARKRAGRCLDQLTQFFRRRGFAVPAVSAGATLFALSDHPSPPALSTSCVAAGMAAGHSVAPAFALKGALKIMAWMKVKTMVVAGAAVLLAVTAAVTVKTIRDSRMYSWRVPKFDPVNNNVLWQAPVQVRILPTKFSTFGGASCYGTEDSEHATCMGICVSPDTIVEYAYLSFPPRIVFEAELPKGRFDFIDNLPRGSTRALQEEVKKKFGVIGRREMRDTNVLVLALAHPEAQGFKPANSLRQSMKVPDTNVLEQDFHTAQGEYGTVRFNRTLAESRLVDSLEQNFQIPVIDKTGLTNRYDFSFAWPTFRDNDDRHHRALVNKALLSQLGLQLVPTNLPIEMLVVEKAR